jgi:hypothetical protein
VSPRYFSPAEVEALIPTLSRIMKGVMAAHTEVSEIAARLHGERERIARSGGGTIDREAWGRDRAQVDEKTAALQAGLTEISELGGETKDLTMGLVDFRHLLRGQEVNLCWRYGETAIGFWHGLEEGYAARKPL